MTRDVAFYTHRDDAIERSLFELIEAHAEEPGPYVVWLADRLASHEICKRLRLVPACSFSSSSLGGGR
jgi:hypothetical protein